MQQSLIFYPLIALVFLTFYILLLLGYKRFQAIKSKSIDVKYFRIYSDYKCPEKLTLISQNFDNLLALPILFYLACIVSFITHHVDILMLALSWLYVISRYAHSAIHIGKNNLKHRSSVFFFNTIMLMIIWLFLAIKLVGSH